MRKLVLFLGALAVTSSEPARSDPRGAKARYATQADIDRLEQEIAAQRELVEKLLALQTQYLKSLTALAQSSPSSSPSPEPKEHTIPPPAGAPEPQPAVITKAPEPRAPERPVATKPKPPAGPHGTGTVLGRVKGGTPGDTYVYVEDIVGPLAHGSASMKQQNRQFVPRALVVQKGTQVEFPNMDAVFHNVFSVTPDNSFDLGSYRQGESKSVHMTKPGVVSVYCNMHPDMVGYILIVPGGFYTRVGQDGFYKLAGVPAGHHRVVAWTPNAKPMASEVDVSESDPATVELELHPTHQGPHTNKDGMAYGSYKE
jgi:plastocyanin